MTDDAGVPDSDPDHIDPAGDIADAVETGEFDIQLAEDQSREELEEFLRKAEAGEHGEIDAALEGQVKMIRAILDEQNDE